HAFLPPGAAEGSWSGLAGSVWRYIVRPIAVGGMLVGAVYTLFRMRTSLASGLKRAVADLRQTAEEKATLSRTERYMSSKVVFGLIGVVFVVMLGLYIYLSGEVVGGIVASVIMLIMGFF